MKKNKLILLLFYVCFEMPSQAQWTQINLNPSIGFSKVQFVNDSIGFANAVKTIMKTSDRGLSWDTIFFNTVFDTTAFINDIFFFNDSTGYFTSNLNAPPYSRFLNKTFDGGMSWSTINSTFPLKKIYFTSVSTGFNMGYTKVDKTTDGGANWTLVHGINSSQPGNIFFFNDSIGYAGGWYPGSISYTRDAGITWQSQHTVDAWDIFATSPDTAYVVGGWSGKIAKTTDGGANWIEVISGLPNSISLFSIYCPDNNTCYAVGDSGIIIKTIDGGNNWQMQNSGVITRLISVYCTDANNCYAAGGVLLKTINGGVGINEHLEKKSEIKIYPNPMRTTAALEISDSRFMISDFILYDVFGRQVKEFGIRNQKAEIRRDKLKDGIYFYKISGQNNFIATGKLIIQ